MLKYHRVQPTILLLSLGIFWGSGYSIARYCMTHGVPPLGYSFWQSIGPAFLLLLICLARIPLGRRYLRYYFFCGLVGIALPNTMMYFGAAHLPSGLLAILVNTVPLFIYPLAILTQQEHFQWKRLFVLAIGLGGIVLVMNTHIALPRWHAIPWALLVLLTPCCFAVCASLINPLKPPHLAALPAATGMLMSSSLLLLPFSVHFHAFYWPHFNLVSGLILLEIILSSLGYVIFFKLLALAGPVFYSLVGGVVSITGLTWGILVFNEHWTILGLIGSISIITAIGFMGAIKVE
jgi:drug/metabolite transporter (DMT)-like permease